MRLCNGSTLSLYLKQNLNVNSSIEGELFGAHNAMTVVLWRKHLIEAQGYTADHNKLYQDKKSTILMENNGRYLTSDIKKHIESRYFFIKDQINQGDMDVEY